MTISDVLREHALYDYRAQLWSIPSDSAWGAAMQWLNWQSVGEANPTERRMFLLFVSEAMK